ncbi:MAG: hypothetical protein IIZ54_03505, partial [Selenomonadaceae bacterium]|nr:hypothetical protein [Selenomonadaceae bacterium]
MVIVRKAVDARRYHGAPIQFVYVLDVLVTVPEKKILAKFRRDRNISRSPEDTGRNPLSLPKRQGGDCRPLVVGFGPAGMFAALVL